MNNFKNTPGSCNGTCTPALWLPSTAENIAENESWANAFYWFDAADVEAWDNSGTLHGDPSESTNPDPYVVVTTPGGTTGQTLNIPEWNNSPINSPVGPMLMVWNSSN